MVLREINQGLSGLADAARRGLVRVNSGRGPRSGSGSGTIWQSDGLIVTNAHVVGRGAISLVLPDGRELPGKVLAADPALDLAAVMVEVSGLPTVALGDSKHLQAGEIVFAMGYPYGIDGGSTSGVVIGTGADLPEMPINNREWIALSLHLRPGHSGGPLLDSAGRLVGVNTMITGPNVGFAIPVHVVKRFLRAALGTVEVGTAPRGRAAVY